jgi:hypothetical protein
VFFGSYAVVRLPDAHSVRPFGFPPAHPGSEVPADVILELTIEDSAPLLEAELPAVDTGTDPSPSPSTDPEPDPALPILPTTGLPSVVLTGVAVALVVAGAVAVNRSKARNRQA